jgi:hypothetical protein
MQQLRSRDFVERNHQLATRTSCLSLRVACTCIRPPVLNKFDPAIALSQLVRQFHPMERLRPRADASCTTSSNCATAVVETGCCPVAPNKSARAQAQSLYTDSNRSLQFDVPHPCGKTCIQNYRIDVGRLNDSGAIRVGSNHDNQNHSSSTSSCASCHSTWLYHKHP